MSLTARVLALDLGEVRIGLAISDALGITAQPLEALTRTGERADLGRLVDLVESRDVGTIVVGLPRLLSGAEGASAEAARRFAGRLTRRLPGVTVELWDERLTTAEAERILIGGNVRRSRRRKVVDGLAASLILQGYLEARGRPDESAG